MTTLMRILKFVGKAPLQVLKAAVSFITGVVATLFLLLAWTYLQQELGFRWMDTTREYAWKYVGSAVFVVCFYETFNLLETRMTARKRVLVTSLGIVFVLSYFSLRYAVEQPAPDIAAFVQRASPPGPPKPYEEAIYDVYSGLLNGEVEQRSLWDKFTNPIPKGVLIRIDSAIDYRASEPIPEGQFDKAVSSAIADYARRSREPFQLQKKFNLPQYDMITTAEEQAALDYCDGRQPEYCREFMRKHHDYRRWVELSAVGFNEDQTVAYLYVVEWTEGFGHGGNRTLFKRNGKWYLVTPTVHSDWVT